MTLPADPTEIMRALSQHVKASVFPHLGSWRARKVTGIASSGDATFSIDEIAEAAVEQFLRENNINVAYYSEDRGLIRLYQDREPDGILIIDPIDGTRGAIAGFEACVVSVAWADPRPEPVLADVRYGAITEIKGGLTFLAERGRGARIRDEAGNTVPITLSPCTDLPAMAWAAEVVGAPTEILFERLSCIANHTTVTGGFFILNSSAFELMRLLTGQLSAVVDIRNRLLRDRPETREKFIECGGGRLISLFAYDIAAAALILQEAGGVLTDAWGRDLSELRLLDTTENNFASMIAAANVELHNHLAARIHASFEG